MTLTWNEALDRFGTDKPDLRFAMELVDLAEAVAGTEFKAFSGTDAVRAITRARCRSLGRVAASTRSSSGPRQLGAAGLVWMRVQQRAARLESPVAKFLAEDHKAGSSSATAAEPGDLRARRRRGAGPDLQGARTAAPGARPAPGQRAALPVLVDHRIPAL